MNLRQHGIVPLDRLLDSIEGDTAAIEEILMFYYRLLKSTPHNKLGGDLDRDAILRIVWQTARAQLEAARTRKAVRFA